MLDALGVPYETRVVSAHRTPERLYDYAKGARERGLQGDHRRRRRRGAPARHDRLDDRAAGARRAGREPKRSKGLDSLLSIVQMPAGVPVGTLAIGEAGATNAGAARGADPGASDDGARRPASWRGARRRPQRSPRRPRIMPDSPLPPGSTIGILGGGQLGRMLALAAARLGLTATSIPTSRTPGLRRRCRRAPSAPIDDEAALARLCRERRRGHLRVRERAGRARSQVAGASRRCFRRPEALAVAQDRLAEKDFLRGLGIPVADFADGA